jgi:hypothetical protein
MSLGYGVVQLDVTIVNTPSTAIGAGLQADVAALQWVVNAYPIGLAAFNRGGLVRHADCAGCDVHAGNEDRTGARGGPARRVRGDCPDRAATRAPKRTLNREHHQRGGEQGHR